MRVATNPYPINGPLAAEDLFVGQEELFTWVQNSLEAGEPLLAVYGLPKMGKTSFLNQLPRRLGSRYRYLVREGSNTPGWQIAPWLGEIQQAVAEAQQVAETPLLLLIDGLSLYTQRPELWTTLVPFLRALTRSPAVRVILALQGHAGQAEAGPAVALRELPALSLRYLTETQVEELLVHTAEDRLRSGQLRYDYDAVNRIYEWTAGHPYLTQLFGYELFDYSGRFGRVNIHAVDKVVDRVLATAGDTLSYLWNALSPAAKMTLAPLGERKGRHELLDKHDIVNFLRWQGVQIPAPDVERALDELTAKGLLVHLGIDSYTLEMELLRRWLEWTKPVGEVVREVKRYRKVTPPRISTRPQRSIPWLSFVFWGMSAILFALMVLVWRSRDLESAPLLRTLTPGAGGIVQSASPTPSAPPPKRIVYARRESKEGPSKLYTMLSDGSDLRALTDKEYQDLQPVWSPDGRRILFVSDRGGNRDLWVMDATGRRLANLTRRDGDDWTPAWCAQSDLIAFSSFRDGNWEIYRMGADGSRQLRLTNHVAADIAPAWSADGQWLVFASDRDGNWEIYLMNRDGEQLRRLTNNDATDLAPAWSPLGDKIAFESYRDGNMEIYTMTPDGGNLINLTNDPGADDHGPAWSPRGDKLLYYADQGAAWDLFEMNADGTGKHNLTRSPASEQNAAYQP